MGSTINNGLAAGELHISHDRKVAPRGIHECRLCPDGKRDVLFSTSHREDATIVLLPAPRRAPVVAAEPLTPGADMVACGTCGACDATLYRRRGVAGRPPRWCPEHRDARSRIVHYSPGPECQDEPVSVAEEDPAAADTVRVCAFDGATCTSPEGCKSDRSCHREDDLERRYYTTERPPPRACASAVGLAAHRRVHEERQPCPNGCGHKPMTQSGLTRHLKSCGVKVTTLSVADLPTFTTPPPAVREWTVQVGSAEILVRVELDGTLLRERTDDRRWMCRLLDLLDDVPEQAPPIGFT